MYENEQNIINILELIEEHIQKDLPRAEPKVLYEPINYLLSAGGKRLRPLLTMLSTGLCGGNLPHSISPAIAFELLHNFTLIHDDIMDHSPTRRGRETIHQKWGEPVGILSGDLLLALAFDKIINSVRTGNPPEILKTFNDSFIEVCEGQGYDMDFETKREITVDEYFLMIEKKTAKLIEKAMVAGGQIANASEDALIKLSNIGIKLGLAFQLQDDLLDLTAQSEKFGKVIGKDLVEGKKTFILIKAKELFKGGTDILLVNKFYENNGLQGDDVAAMIEALRRNGIFELVSSKIKDYYNSILKDLEEFEESRYKELFGQLVENIFTREY